ncbi:MAG: TIGR02302 family protein [Paracoccaceae bacterium]
MASFSRHDMRRSLAGLRWPLRLTQVGMIAEQVLRCFWPLIALVLGVLGILMLGLQDMLPLEIFWGGVGIFAVTLLIALITGARRFIWPTRASALHRLDATMTGRPIQALLDTAAVGSDDPDAMGVWRAHQARMAERAEQAKTVQPDLRIAGRDPFALRYSALLVFVVALLFGSIWRVGSVTTLAAGAVPVASGPTWEGWVESPRYTGRPTLYLNDIASPTLDVAQGSVITLRLYGEVGALNVSETVSGTPVDATQDASELSQEFVVDRNGALKIEGAGGQSWTIHVIPDASPKVAIAGVAEATAVGEITLPFTAMDDYGVELGFARIELDLDAVDRRYGLEIAPDPREPVIVPLPTPITGDRREFTENLIDDFSQHAFSNLPVTVTLNVQDAIEQDGKAAPEYMVLLGRRFFDPMAAAIIEQRRDLLWARANANRVAQQLRAISHRPDDIFRSETAYLRLRVILRRIEALAKYDLKPEQQSEIVQALWDLAILLEEGDLSDALERLRRAQERLSEAMKNGASDQEIAELMQELREASDDYIRQLSRQAEQDGEQNGDRQSAENSMEMTQDDLQAMMDRIQELMEQGRMAEAEQALKELQQLMENMRVTQGQGQGGQSPGEQAMEGLADTLRQQQGLSDEAFRDLQEQFNPGAQAGESEGNEGRNGGQGRGQSHEGQDGQGNGQSGQESDSQGAPGASELADRQRALRRELGRQQDSLPGAGTPEGDAARDAIGRAERSMEGAEEALRDRDFAEAIDQQSAAIEALREGMRNLGEAMAQQQNQPGQGAAESDRQAQNRDPLGREAGSNGSAGTNEDLLQGEDVYRRARELLDEIRRRTGDGERPEMELEYLKRLLERF